MFRNHRPIIRDTIKRSYTKIRRMESWKVCGIQYRAAPNSIKICGFNWSVRIVYWVIRRPSSDIRAVTKVLTRFPISTVTRVFRGLTQSPARRIRLAYAFQQGSTRCCTRRPAPIIRTSTGSVTFSGPSFSKTLFRNLIVKPIL
ncbi:MAG: hypothetical protein CM1200mP24_10040 [Gammaproteobacteria bacterium]|nr:MAG: hypothetical protein CM1200mP24_10040 [Gammaproteobacteria bacterium]